MGKRRGSIKLFAVVLMLLLFVDPTTEAYAQATDIGAELTDGIIEAVDQAFEDIPSNVRIAVIHMQTASNEVSMFLLDELQHILVRRRFIVVDRADLDRIRAERDFQYTYEVDDKTAVSIGKFVGADLVVTGSISGTDTLRRLRLKVIDTQTAIIKGTASVAVGDTRTGSTTPTTRTITQSVTNLIVTPSIITVTRGLKQQFNATVIGTGDLSQVVTWDVIGSNSSFTSINHNGVLNVASNETATTLIVKAVSTVDVSKSGVATVTLQDTPPAVFSVSIRPSNVTVLRGSSQEFSAVVRGEENPVQTVDWTVSGNRSSGTVISDNGLLSIASNETAEKVKVRATSTVDPRKNGTSTVKTTPPAPYAIKVFGGIGFNTATENVEVLETTSKIGFNFGVSSDIRLGKAIFMLEPGLKFVRKVILCHNYHGGNGWDPQGYYTYIDIFTKAKLNLGDDIVFAFQPYCGYAMSLLTAANNHNGGESIDIYEDCNKLGHEMLLGADIVISDAFVIGAQYDIGLTNIWKEGFTEVRLNTFWINLGCKF